MFIGLTPALQLSGCMALHRVLHGRYGLWPLVAGLFPCNWIFLFGLLSYLFGVGLLLWATAVWIGLAAGSGTGAKLLWGTALSLALFFSHLIAFGLFALIVAGYETQRALPMLCRQCVQALRYLLVGASIFVVPVILLAVCFLATPHELFGGWGADTRIPLVIVLVLIACVRPVLRDRRWKTVSVAVLGGALLVQSALRSYDWLGYDAVIGEFRTAFGALPANSVLLIASETDMPSFQDINLRLWQPPLPHVATLAVLEGGGIFVPDTFAQVGQQPITVTAPYSAIYRCQSNKPFKATTTEALQGFITHAQRLLAEAGSTDPVFVLLLYPQEFNLALPAHTTVAASTSRALLLAVERAASP